MPASHPPVHRRASVGTQALQNGPASVPASTSRLVLPRITRDGRQADCLDDCLMHICSCTLSYSTMCCCCCSLCCGNLWKREWVIHPDRRRTWDVITLLLVIYTSLAIPFAVAFAPRMPLGLVLLDITVDLLFMTDIVLNMFTAY